MEFTNLVDLASERLGGMAMAANDEFFAPKENLLKAGPAIVRDREYTDRGKWMDGWETRRRREPGHDWCIIRLGLAGRVRGVVVDTSHFKGNFPRACSLDSCALDGYPSARELCDASVEWTTILPESRLVGDSENRFPSSASSSSTHLRLNIFPDGGVARLRVYGDVMPDWPSIKARSATVDLAAVEHGGLVISSSDMFFGSRHNLIMPGNPRDMSDGWETKRRRGPGHDWVIIRLGAPGIIRHVEVDTTHFKGNAPGACSLEGSDASQAEVAAESELLTWRPLLSKVNLQPHQRHVFAASTADSAVTHVRFNIFPDGGVARLRLLGEVKTI